MGKIRRYLQKSGESKASDITEYIGLSNWIALPLQEQSFKKGYSAFIDEVWNTYINQWKILKETSKLSKAFIEKKLMSRL